MATHGFKKAEGWVGLGLGLGLIGLASPGYLLAGPRMNNALGFALLFFAPIVGLICLIWAFQRLYFARHVFHIHERGVHRVGRSGGVVLRYADVRGVIYEATVANFHCFESLVLTPDSGPTFRLWTNQGRFTREPQTPMSIARDLASRAVGRRMAALLAQGRPVDWINGAQIEPAGLRTHNGRFIHWADLELKICNGVVEFIAAGAKVYKAAAKVPNFYPGYHLIRAYRRQARPDWPGIEA